jgi:hypothetical protein
VFPAKRRQALVGALVCGIKNIAVVQKDHKTMGPSDIEDLNTGISNPPKDGSVCLKGEGIGM